jgi:uncharacterized protein GlcG (DUF336 family)
MKIVLAVACLAAPSASVCAAPAPAPMTVADERLAAPVQRDLAERAIAVCRSRGAHVAVAIAGPDRVVRTLLSDDRATPLAIETARRKAMSAAMLGYPTSGLTKALQEAPAYVELLRSYDPQLITIGGGVPIRGPSGLLGGMGVGGAAGPEADEACANDALTQVLPVAGR